MSEMKIKLEDIIMVDLDEMTPVKSARSNLTSSSVNLTTIATKRKFEEVVTTDDDEEAAPSKIILNDNEGTAVSGSCYQKEALSLRSEYLKRMYVKDPVFESLRIKNFDLFIEHTSISEEIIERLNKDVQNLTTSNEELNFETIKQNSIICHKDEEIKQITLKSENSNATLRKTLVSNRLDILNLEDRMEKKKTEYQNDLEKLNQSLSERKQEICELKTEHTLAVKQWKMEKGALRKEINDLQYEQEIAENNFCVRQHTEFKERIRDRFDYNSKLSALQAEKEEVQKNFRDNPFLCIRSKIAQLETSQECASCREELKQIDSALEIKKVRIGFCCSLLFFLVLHFTGGAHSSREAHVYHLS
jgi:hypothetical protein